MPKGTKDEAVKKAAARKGKLLDRKIVRKIRDLKLAPDPANGR